MELQATITTREQAKELSRRALAQFRAERRPGRPRIPEHARKNSLTIRVTNAARRRLETMAKERGFKSIGELLEDYALQ